MARSNNLWIIMFFSLYGLYWNTIYTSSVLYQLTLQPALAILMGYGIFRAKDFMERNAKDKLSLHVTKEVKSAGIYVVLILIILLFSMSTDVFMPESQSCLTNDVIAMAEHVGIDDCLLIENSESFYSRMLPIRIMKIMLPEKNVETSLWKCGNKDDIYYLYINHTMCDTTFFGPEQPVFEQLQTDYEMRLVEERHCIRFYKIEES